MKDIKITKATKRLKNGVALCSTDERMYFEFYETHFNIEVYNRVDEEPQMVLNNLTYRGWAGDNYDLGLFIDNMQYIGTDFVGKGSRTAFLCGDMCILMTELPDGRLRIKIA